VRGSQRNTYTRGVICEKVGRYAERVHHPDRLLHPLRRVGPKGAGRFERIGWDEALDAVAEAFTRRARTLGPETVWPYYYAGTMGLVQRDGINRLRHALGYSRYYSTICVTLADTGWAAGVGAKRGVDLREIDEHSDLVVIWGGNPVNTQVNVMSHAMAARRRGATLVVVDPYRTGTAARADLHLAPRPGTDGALACAMMHVLFAEGLADWDYLRAYTDCPDELAAHVATRTPEWAAAITGLPASEIVSFARLYGRTRKSFIRCHHGFSRSRNGAVNMHAVSCLPAITGAWRYEGGGAVYGQTALYPLDRTLIEGLDMVDKSIRALDQSRLGPILTGDTEALLGGPPVTAMLVQNTNPAMVCPETRLVHRGLAREDLFLCVHEQFLTETAAFADIVLPATMMVEHDDFYTASGHTYFQVAKKIIEPPGECRENHWVICQLAKRLGATHPGFQMTAWEIMDETLRRSGMWDALTNWRPVMRGLVGWDIGIGLYVILAVEMMLRADVHQIRRRAATQDDGAIVILVLTVATALASLLAIVVLLGTSAAGGAHRRSIDLVLATITIGLSWLFIHTMFALHYAHEFYGDSVGPAGGMAFPGGDEEPDYWDFVYFSFVIGMTSQVSDVAITNKPVRRTVTAHAVVSFAFNVALLALTVNIAASAL